ncbi:Uncharacterized protein YtfP, partial [Ananas comosus]
AFHGVLTQRLTENYPRGNKELRGSFFNVHGPQDTMGWFSDHGVQLKTEDDGRVFPVSNSSASIVDCLLNEAKRVGVSLQTGKVVSSTSVVGNGKFLLKVEKRTIDFVEHLEAKYVLVATGSSKQGYLIATQLGHSIIDPMPSLFTFKIEDAQLASLSGVGPMLVTHWGLSGPVILRLSAWGARMLLVDFVPGIHIQEVKGILFHHKDQFAGLDGDVLWSSIPKSNLISIALLLKQYSFKVVGKGQFKDEFVTAGGVPLSEISLNTMESKKQPNLFFAGEVLNIDGVTGGFNFQNAWTGGYIAGTSIGTLASSYLMREVS